MTTPSVAQKSNLFVLQIGDGATTEIFTKVAALTDVQLKVTVGSIDVTTKDTGGFASMLEGGGQKSVQVTASGMMHNNEATQALLKAKVLGGTNWNYKIVDEAGNTWAMRALITDWSEKGAVNGVQTFDVTLSSDGVVTYTTAP